MSFHELPTATNELETRQACHVKMDISAECDDSKARALPPPTSPPVASSSTGDDSDSDWNDWESDADQHTRLCPSLFDGTVHAGPGGACAYDAEKYGVDLDALCKRLGLDFYSRTRLVNYIRREKATADVVLSLTGRESLFSDDQYLQPVLEDDPLLGGLGEWSEEEGGREDRERRGKSVLDPVEVEDKDREIRRLTHQLDQARRDLEDFRALIQKQFRQSEVAKALESDSLESSDLREGKTTAATRDDDSHYFDSYSSNEIHHVMLRDSVRTATYASFILNAPDIFEGATVLDVGCGTGILSLFAARAGAKRVFAVDASAIIAEKARKTVKANNLQDVITVITGKVEDIALPDGITHVDIIVSEWMGYALLYESMLDSVIVARDRFLKPGPEIASAEAVEMHGTEGPSVSRGGTLVPSQVRMLLGLCAAHEVYKEKMEFWDDVYGFDMSSMAEDVYSEAVIEVVSPESILSDAIVIKDINLYTTTPRELSFVSPFELRSSTPQRIAAHALMLYFDTFFAADGTWQASPDMRAQALNEEGPILAEVWRVPSPVNSRIPSTSSNSGQQPQQSSEKEKARLKRRSRRSSTKVSHVGARASFTTGPESLPTHWKQTLFMLREPILVHESTIVKGTFHCRKSEDNSRELDIEIHYVVRDTDHEGNVSESPMYVQSYKVR